MLPGVVVGPLLTADVACESGQLTHEDAEALTVALKALSCQSRMLMISIIAHAGSRGLRVSDLIERVSLSQPAISNHLRVLQRAGLVEVLKEGTFNYYTVNGHYAKRVLSVMAAVLGESTSPTPRR